MKETNGGRDAKMKEMMERLARYAVSPLSLARRESAAREIAGAGNENLPGILRAVRARCGVSGLLAADAILFGWCLLAAVAIDFLIPMSETARDLIGAVCCLAAFGVWEREPLFALGKVCLIVLSAVYCSYWTVAVLLLAALEHYAAFRAEGNGVRNS